MLKNLKSTVKNSIIYGMGNISTKIVGFILLPFYTKHLSISDYGILGILEITAEVIISIFGLNLCYAFYRWYWDEKYKNIQKEMFFTILFFLSILSIIFFLCFSFFSLNLAKLLFQNEKYSYLLKLMLLTSFLSIIFQVPTTLMQLQEKAIMYSIINVFKLFINLVLTIYFVVFLSRSVEGIYEAQLISFIISFLFIFKYMYKNIKVSFKYKVLLEMLNFSFPLVLSSISSLALNLSDRYFLKFLSGLSDVGTYSLGFKLANTIKVFIVSSFQLAISPQLYKMMNDKNCKRFYSKIMTYSVFLVIFFVLLASFFGKETIKFIAKNRDYWDAYKVIPIISFTILISLIKDNASIGLVIMKKTKIVSVIVTFISVINLLLNGLFIYYWKTLGAAFANLLSQIIFLLLVYYYSQKHFYINYEIKKIFKMIILAIILILFSYIFNQSHLIIRLIVKSSLLFLYPIILYYLDFYEEIELQRLKESYRKWKNIENIRKFLLNRS